MKNLLVLSLLATVFVLGACGQKHNDTTYKASRTSGGVNGANASNPIVTGNASSNPGSWGQITNYQRADVVNFLSSGLTSDQIGYVNNTDMPNCHTLNNQPCVIVFNVSINPDSQNFNALTLIPGGPQYMADPSQGGILTIGVYDSLTGNGTSAIASPAALQSASMTYSNSNSGMAILTFGNTSGTITLSASTSSQYDVQGQAFSGTISFNYNGQNETLGQFNTNICYVFQCQ